MSIATIRQTAEALVATTLGAGYKPLSLKFDAEGNDSRSLSAGYTVLWGEAQEFLGPSAIDQLVNIEQDLDVTITKRAFVRTGDERSITVMDTLYAAIGTIIKNFVRGKIGLAGTVQEVRLISMSKPEPLNDEQRDIIRIDLKFQVRYLIT